MYLLSTYLLLSFIFLPLLFTTGSVHAAVCTSDWASLQNSGRWLGPYWWATPLYDWKSKPSNSIPSASVPAYANRTLNFMKCDVNHLYALPQNHRNLDTLFTISSIITIKQRRPSGFFSRNYRAGFRIGLRGPHDGYLSAAVDADKFIEITYSGQGFLSIGDIRIKSANLFPFLSTPVATIKASLKCIPLGPELVILTFDITNLNSNTNSFSSSSNSNSNSASLSKIVSLAKIRGAVGLVVHGRGHHYAWAKKRQDEEVTISFSKFLLSGAAVRNYGASRSFGPILWTQYSLSKKVLRLTANFAPLPRGTVAQFWTRPSSSQSSRVSSYSTNTAQWQRQKSSFIDPMSQTATFVLPSWQAKQVHVYTVRVSWNGRVHSYVGVIRKEPTKTATLKIGVFSCDKGYMFPHTQMVREISSYHDPDLLYFAGDQIYEKSTGPYAHISQNEETAMLDYHMLNWRFGLTWRNALRNRPSIVLPDDHDVFHANLWGGGGVRLGPKIAVKNRKFEYGGYIMSSNWLRAVEKIHVSHLPPSPYQVTLPVGIKPYFTDVVYAGVSFAVLEDRKFKTGPLSLPKFRRRFGQGASLLGTAQESFLARWGIDWKGHVMKVALSQTILAKANTHVDKDLYRLSLPFYDTGAWPTEASKRAVSLLRRARAISLHGDQHLGIFLIRDQVPMFMVPGTANGFPRAFWPKFRISPSRANAVFGGEGSIVGPGRRYLGVFNDDAGNEVDVLAVANPRPGSNQLAESARDAAYKKGSGYGIVTVNKVKRTVNFKLYRNGGKSTTPELFDGFSRTVFVGGRPQGTKQQP